MNVYLLEQIKMAIEAEPAQFAMGNWFTPQEQLRPESRSAYSWSSQDLRRDSVPNCGTAACIGGWALALGHNKPPATTLLPIGSARGILMLDDYSFDRLTLLGRWPFEFKKRWFEEKTLEGRSRIACDRIDHFIATDGAE